jgi:Putative MetA-pathway of phenol degradation
MNFAPEVSTERIPRRNETVMRLLDSIIGTTLIVASGAASAEDQQPICADRPSRSTGECTVPVGRWQVETGLVDWTHDSSSDFTTFGSSLIKTGLSDRADLELGITPIETVRINGGGTHQHDSSFGDIIARVKYALTANDAPVQVALDPFVKLPTANHRLGNGKVEAGMLVATSASLGKSGLTLSLDPELDWVADAEGGGHHVATQQVLNLGFAATKRLSLSAELWARWDWEPTGTGKQVSADGSVAYLLDNNVQLDAGANLGVSKQTPDLELYTGISTRF